MSEWYSINNFAYPWLLWLLPLPFILLAWNIYRVRHAPSVTYSDLNVFRGIAPSMRQRFLSVMPLTRALVLCLGIIALARPQYGTVNYDVNTLGIDIELVLDVSGSMQQTDFVPNRLEAAKRSASQFVEGRETDRVGVTIFGTKAAILCPPTLDMAAVTMFLEAITDGIIDNGGTAIGDGLGLAIKKLEDSEAESKVIILLTDGEDNASQNMQPLQAAEVAESLGMRVYTIGVGGGGGMTNAFGMMMRGGPSFDASLLREIATMTDGKYYHAKNTDSLEEIYEEIDRLEKTELEINETADFDERFMIFWIPGLILLAMEFLLRAFVMRRLP